MLSVLVSALLGWLIGSVPVAYLVVRRARGVDLARAGSGNVGANNAFRTTGSRAVGIAVLVLDAAKGVLAVLLGWQLAGWLADSPAAMLQWFSAASALLAAIAGHNYNLFLSLRGGRLAGGKGLATAAAGFLLLTPVLVGIWIALWMVGFGVFAWWRAARDAIPGNVLATALIPLAGWLLYGPEVLFVVLIFAALVLPKHVRQIRALVQVPSAVHAARSTPDGSSTGQVQEGVKPVDTTR